MDLRDIIVWLGLIAIVVIVWDGLRRMRSRAGATKRRAKDQEPYIDPEEAAKKAQIARELPNGGARIREMTDSEKQEVQSRLNLRERVPMLMERVKVASEASDQNDSDGADRNLQAELDFNSGSSATSVSEGDDVAEASDELSFSAVDEAFEAEGEDLRAEGDPDDEFESTATPDESVEETATSSVLSDVLADDEVLSEPASGAVSEEPSSPAHKTEAVAEPEPEPPLGPVEDLVVVHVMARRDEEFSGSSVLDLLLTAGLRHGPMDIFHYRNPQGVTEFSLANCVQPGTFDPDAMNQVNTPGVTLFMQLPNGADALEAFEHMVEMARFLAQHLEGDLLDEDHSSVTPQRVEYYREKIRSFERTRLIPS